MSVLPTVVWSDLSGRIEVVDGDTFRVSGTLVRLHGIDAPEVDQTCTRPGAGRWDCGKWVKGEVKRLYGGMRTRCEVITTDRYGRAVSKCRVRGEDVGAVLVQSGLAFAYRQYSLDYDLEEKRAAVQGVGLHGSRVQSPSAFRKARTQGTTAPDPSCVIKGNISKAGRIYHVPGQRDYERTGINLKKGERWFCSAAQARAAGWRAARR